MPPKLVFQFNQRELLWLTTPIERDLCNYTFWVASWNCYLIFIIQWNIIMTFCQKIILIILAKSTFYGFACSFFEYFLHICTYLAENRKAFGLFWPQTDNRPSVHLVASFYIFCVTRCISSPNFHRLYVWLMY